MQIKQAGLKAFFWVTNSQLAQVMAGIVLLPFMVKILSPEEIGLWYLFFSFFYLYQLLDFGFSPTFIRKINHQLAHLSDASQFRDDLTRILATTKAYYKKLSLSLGCVIFTAGSLYIWLSFRDQLNTNAVLTWILFFTSLVLNFFYNYQSVILQGFGKVEEVGFAQAISRLLTIFLSIICLWLGVGLLSMGIAYLIGTLSMRLMLNHKARKITEDYDISGILVSSRFKDLIDSEAVKLGLSSISSFFINRSGTFFISSMVGLAANASFSISLQFFQLITSLSMIPFHINLPFLNFQRKKVSVNLYNKFYSITLLCLCLYIMGSLIFFFSWRMIFDIFNFNVTLLSTDQLILIAIVSGLELNHVIHATFLTTKGTVPFANAAVISAAFIIATSFFATPIYGIYGVLGARAIVQALYNNWKWPLEVYTDFKGNK